MSGIFGLWNLTGQPVKRDILKDMAVPMQRRGPDGTDIAVDGSVGMGHAHLAIMPTADGRQLPFVDVASGMMITADARLDNRDALISRLDIRQASDAIVDADIILAAFQKWDCDCVDHLIGDFAFAIWDALQNRLFCARDQVGMKQFIYTHSTNGLFAFATDFEAILTLDNVPKRINEARILDYLVENLEGIDTTSTFYEGLYRLPPAHTMLVENQGISVRRYWQLEAPPQLQLSSDDEYVEAFHEVFSEAVACRLRGGDKVGAMLSGGLDSNSVVATASKIRKDESFGPLKTFSATDPDNVSCKETLAIMSMAGFDGIEPTYLNFDDLEDHSKELQTSLEAMKEPFDGHMMLSRLIYLTSSSKGVKVMLDARGGDNLMGTGAYSARLIRQGRLLSAWAHLRGQYRFEGNDQLPITDYLRFLILSIAPSALLRARDTALMESRAEKLRIHSGVSMEFARKHKLSERLARFRSHNTSLVWHDEQAERAHMFSHPNNIVGSERYDRVAAEFGIETRDPYSDIRLARFCASLPSQQKSNSGRPKQILRKAFSGVLPDPITSRMGKEHLGGLFLARFFEVCDMKSVRSMSTRYVDGAYQCKRSKYDDQLFNCWITKSELNIQP